MLGPINRRQLEDLLVTYAHLSAAGVTEREIRKYAEFIVDICQGERSNLKPDAEALISIFYYYDVVHISTQRVVVVLVSRTDSLYTFRARVKRMPDQYCITISCYPCS